MACSFVVYVDEAGDEGFSFTRGSSEWFVLSAVVTLKAEDLETVKLVDRVRRRLGRPDHKPLHFRDLRHEHRLPLIEEISRASLRVATLLIHKPSIPSPEEFRGNSLLYFQAVDELMERVSRLCRGGRSHVGDGSADIIVSTRAGLSFEGLREVFRSSMERFGPDAAIRHEQVYTYTAGRRMGLQIADAVASGFLKAVESSEYGHTEDRYARMLRPVLYRRDEACYGHGLRFWPPAMERRLQEKFDWARDEEEKEG
jgi:hypothetical protein